MKAAESRRKESRLTRKLVWKTLFLSKSCVRGFLNFCVIVTVFWSILKQNKTKTSYIKARDRRRYNCMMKLRDNSRSANWSDLEWPSFFLFLLVWSMTFCSEKFIMALIDRCLTQWSHILDKSKLRYYIFTKYTLSHDWIIENKWS